MKFIITGLHCSGKRKIANILSEFSLKEGKLFSNINKEDIADNIYNSVYYQNYNINDINTIFENNAYIFLKELNYNDYKRPFFEGLSIYDFENSDFIILSPDQLISIPVNVFEKYINKNDICIVWVDNSKSYRIENYNLEKRNYSFPGRECIEREDINVYADKLNILNNTKKLYFSNDDPEKIASVILSYKNAEEPLKKLIESCFK